MIDRTTFDLRIAEHYNSTARANQPEWQQAQPNRRSLRVFLANVLVSLAARLDPIAGTPHKAASAAGVAPA